MIGGHPTGTPPMWTTLATGCYANVHGITCFNCQSDKGPEYTSYALDSRRCKAEPLWNIFAENGMKTLVFNWPGSSWPPTSDSENLHVVDGTNPGGVNHGTGIISKDFYIYAKKSISDLAFKEKGEAKGIAPCAIDDLEVEKTKQEMVEEDRALPLNKPDRKRIMLDNTEGTDGFVKYAKYDHVDSPLKPAENWADALEMTSLFSGGLVRRPALVVKNEEGKYDTVKIYKSKKETNPLTVLKKGVMVHI